MRITRLDSIAKPIAEGEDPPKQELYLETEQQCICGNKSYNAAKLVIMRDWPAIDIEECTVCTRPRMKIRRELA